jgi:hypothetical protein
MQELQGVLVRTYKVRMLGLRGAQVTLAPSWMEDEDVAAGDVIEERRDGEFLILRHVKRGRVQP